MHRLHLHACLLDTCIWINVRSHISYHWWSIIIFFLDSFEDNSQTMKTSSWPPCICTCTHGSVIKPQQYSKCCSYIELEINKWNLTPRNYIFHQPMYVCYSTWATFHIIICSRTASCLRTTQCLGLDWKPDLSNCKKTTWIHTKITCVYGCRSISGLNSHYAHNNVSFNSSSESHLRCGASPNRHILRIIR